MLLKCSFVQKVVEVSMSLGFRVSEVLRDGWTTTVSE